MLLRTWRFFSLLLAALTTGMGLCHLMELPARLEWDRSLWVEATVVGGLYRMFGLVGGPIVVATVLTAVVLALMVRRRGSRVFGLTAAGAALFAIALAAWFAFVFPVNQELATWLSGDIPPNWIEGRNRWEYTHAINAVLQICGLGALLLSVLLETPSGPPPEGAR